MARHFQRHARERMIERNITEGEVEAALNHPVSNEPGNRPGTSVVLGHAGSRMLKVVVETADRNKVISVWELEG